MMLLISNLFLLSRSSIKSQQKIFHPPIYPFTLSEPITPRTPCRHRSSARFRAKSCTIAKKYLSLLYLNTHN